MTVSKNDDELSEDAIEMLLASDQRVRDYIAKVVAGRPVWKVLEEWKSNRPDDFREMCQGAEVGVVKNLVSEGDLLNYGSDEDLTPLKEEFVTDLRENVDREIREVQQRLTLTPLEFSVYLLTQAANWSEERVADEIESSPEEVQRSLERAREKFRTAMRMIDLCERLDDPELRTDLEGWRIFRDPVLSREASSEDPIHSG